MSSNRFLDYFCLFLLFSPELSISALPWLDGTLLLLLILLIYRPINKSLLTYAGLLGFLLVFLYLFQSYIKIDAVVEGNVRFEQLRTNGTWGRLNADAFAIDWFFLLRNLIKLFASVVIVSWLISIQNKLLLKRIIITLSLYTLVFYLMVYTGVWSTFVKVFFHQKFLLFEEGDTVHVRDGWVRLDLGFSEPSYLIASLMALSVLFRPKMIQLTPYAIGSLILFAMTRSVSVIVLFAIHVIKTKKAERLNPFLLLFIIAVMLLFNSDFIVEAIRAVDINPSFVFRLLGIFDFSSIGIGNYLFGVRMWDIYVQPPLGNLLVQMGIVGLSIFYLFSRNFMTSTNTIILIAFLFVSPQIYNISFFILILLLKRGNHVEVKRNNNCL